MYTNAARSSLAEKERELDSSEIKLVVLEPCEKQKKSEVPIIDGNAITDALKIADRVQDEAHRIWTSKNVICNKLLELNRRNAYTFVGYMITTSNSQSAIGDIKKYLTYDGLRHLIINLLKLAEDCDLQGSFQYKKLKKEYYKITKISSLSIFKSVNKKIAEECNLYIENLFFEMCKILN